MEDFPDDFVSYDGEDTFLKIKTIKRGLIKGESRDAQHPEEICIDWWSWGMEARSSLSGAGGSSKATLKPLHIVIRADRASTALMSTLRNNDLIKEMVLSVRKAGRPHAYFKIFFENARITFLEVRTVTWNGQPALVVYLSFSVQNFRVEYVRQNKDGGEPATPGPVSTAAQISSLALDVTPGVGALKSAVQVVTGTALVTGAPVSRGVEAVGIVAGLIPGGKALLKGAAKASEKLGEIGMKQAQKRTGQVPDERFTERYHGPDGMTRDKDGKLCEWECKGRADGSIGVAKHKDGKKQISEKANRKYAEKMLGKQEHGKIGKLPGPKIGGPYNSNEMGLYQEIEDRRGQKRHLSSHTNTTTGRVQVFERDGKGSLGKKLDDFTLDDFENVKQRIFKEVGE